MPQRQDLRAQGRTRSPEPLRSPQAARAMARLRREMASPRAAGAHATAQVDRTPVDAIPVGRDQIVPAELVLAGQAGVAAGAPRNRPAYLAAGGRQPVASEGAE